MNDVISQLKNNNKLINIIRCYPQISKAALAEYLKVSWPTVSTNIEVLRKSNILSASSPLLINPDFAHMIGISVGSAQTKQPFVMPSAFTSSLEVTGSSKTTSADWNVRCVVEYSLFT